MTEREKIIKVIDEWANKAVKANKFDGASVYNPHNAAELADALIAAGIGYIREAEHRAARAEHELERRLAEATKAMYVYERALYYATLNGETADEVKYNDALKRAQKDFAENKGD